MELDHIPRWWDWRFLFIYLLALLYFLKKFYNCHVLLMKLKSLASKIGMMRVWPVILETEETILYLYFLCLRGDK